MISKYIFDRHSSQIKSGRIQRSKDTFFEYYWVPSLNWSLNSPTLIYFIGYDGRLPKKPNRNKKWNVLFLRDSQGPNGKGCWFFGEKGNPKTLNAVKSFIDELLLSKIISKKYLFFAGKGMGGHAAIYFQIIFGSIASYTHNPTINLLDSNYVRGNNIELFKSIFDHNNIHAYQDLRTSIPNLSVTNKIYISHTANEYFYDEHFSEINKFENVFVNEHEDYYFSSIFEKLDPMTRKTRSQKIQSNSIKELKGELEDSISLRLSSRELITIKENFDFNYDPYDDRSWRFWFQNLSWVKEHILGLEVEIQKVQFDYIINRWFQFLQTNEYDQEFFYHDHSLAYRAMNLIDCLPFCTDDSKEMVLQHIFDIGLLLVSPFEDNSLSNHAFDQAIALFQISEILTGRNNLKKWQELSISRIERELSYSFTKDGVHVENSPAYHHGMIANLHKSLGKVLANNKNEFINNEFNNLSKLVPFLLWIIRPDGSIPPIGDSQEKKVSLELARVISPKSFEEVFEGLRVFGEGYAIWKSVKRQFHLTMKSTFKGRFHRHDDDCSITLWSNGTNLILDSGLLYYKEKDENRIHVRSAKAHSGFEIPNKTVSRNFYHAIAKQSLVKKIDGKTAVSTLGMYPGIDVKREIKNNESIIVISDKFCEKSLSLGIRQNFILSDKWDIQRFEDCIQFTDNKGMEWIMRINNQDHFNSFSIEDTFHSPQKNVIHKAKRISFAPKSNETKIEIIIGKK